MHQAQFSIGQLIVHKKFNYRGVIYDVDAEYTGTKEWYEKVAKSQPPKDKPWYHILVDGQLMTTYVAETEDFFDSFEDGAYQNYRLNN